MSRLCLALLLSACPPVLPQIDVGPTFNPTFKHAHNDYEHTRPLLDALDAKFESVEADLWLDGTDLGVSHGGAPYKGSLKSLYLEPLAARLAANNGSVHGDGKPFFLWLDLKNGSAALQSTLAAQLADYAFLTRFDDAGQSRAGAVTVVLTGDDAGKRALVDLPAPRPYIRDSNSFSVNDPPADGKWGFYAVNYYAFMQWDGAGAIPATQRRQLENLINGAHATGRPIRLFANPDTTSYWSEAKAAHADFVNTDKLAELAAAFSQ
ncbi:MAG: hypothetical protein Q8N23_10215 [Archangium sp.]|nr:hypothetical protein [Archangium sp.]MDP3153034.1 hypothetical protein [Archangium sp.]MDP3572578.1 hypothetical protein [Archangium sp.]